MENNSKWLNDVDAALLFAEYGSGARIIAPSQLLTTVRRAVIKRLGQPDFTIGATMWWREPPLECFNGVQRLKGIQVTSNYPDDDDDWPIFSAPNYCDEDDIVLLPDAVFHEDLPITADIWHKSGASFGEFVSYIEQFVTDTVSYRLVMSPYVTSAWELAVRNVTYEWMKNGYTWEYKEGL